MVCQTCSDLGFKLPDEDCINHLMSLLAAHIRAKDKEVADMKEQLKREKPSMGESEVIPSSYVVSQLIFSDDTSSTDGLPEDTSDEENNNNIYDQETYMPSGQLPISSSSPIEPVRSDDSREDAENVNPARNRSPVRKPLSPLQPGWRRKPTRLSFSNLHNRTKLFTPKKPLKPLTLQQCVERQKIKQKTKSDATADPVAIIKIDDDDDDDDVKENRLFRTSIRSSQRKRQKVDEPVKTAKKKIVVDLTGFCDGCREFYEINPPIFQNYRDRMKKLKECEQHKKKKFAGHLTPPGFWDVGFGPTPEQMKTQIYVKPAKKQRR